MKKFIILLVGILLLTTGCGKIGKKEVIRDLNKKIQGLKSYYVEGKMEIINNEDVYKYDVYVAYKNKDLFKVSLKNESNNHEQIILKNKEGVYVLTPSLNKSFKFESNWPYNNSQIYLLQSILSDINNDKALEFNSKDDSYIITTSVNYPNNKDLVKQNIYLDKKLNLKQVLVLNSNGNAEIKMIFNKISENNKFEDDYFDLKKTMETTKVEEQSIDVSKIDDAIFPMYLPSNTSLKSQNTISKDNGERLILTFAGDKPFVLVEETISKSNELEIVPTLGEPTILLDTIGSLSENSASWISNGIEYYIASDVLSEDELSNIAKSISTIPVMK